MLDLDFKEAREFRDRFVIARDEWVRAAEEYGENSPEEQESYEVYLFAEADYYQMLGELEDIKRQISVIESASN